MSIEIIGSIIMAVLMTIAAAFGLGHVRGTSKADEKAEKRRIEENAAAAVAVAERRLEVTKGASDVEQIIKHLPDDGVDRELRENFTRKT